MVGSRYAVFSKSGDTLNPHGGKTFENVKAAEQFLQQQYPVKVA